MAPMTQPTTLTLTITRCQLIPVQKEATMSTITTPLEAPASSRTSQRVPLWLITNPHTPQEARWLIIAWERRGDLLSAAVVAEDQDLTMLQTWPMFIQDGDLISTVPDAWAPQAPPVRWAEDTDGNPLFWAISGWTWSGGNPSAVVTLYDAEDLERQGMGLPVWTCKDTGGNWMEGYAIGWCWENGQLIPQCSLENAESLDMWESIIRPTLASLGV